MHLKSIIFYPEKYPTSAYYPFNLPIFKETKKITLDAPVTMFVGENGTGKSTLLEALAVACKIHIWRYSERNRPDHNPYEGMLHKYISVEWANELVPGSFFSSKIFQQFAELLDEWAAADRGQLNYFGGKSLTTQSHGQSLMSFFRSRYKIRGLYLLDEPETALSPRSQIEMLALLKSMSASGQAQFIIATHSPILLACLGAKIYAFDQMHVQQIQYEDTDHYRIYKGFLDDRNKYLNNDDRCWDVKND